MKVREATDAELDSIVALQRDASGSDDEAELTRVLLADPEASPKLSMVATDERGIVGHILLTRAWVQGHDQTAGRVMAADELMDPKYRTE